MATPTRMSDAARRQVLEPSEGLRLIAYRDCVGVLTIGYGHTSMAGAPVVREGMKITAAEADEILSRDLGKFERGVAALLTTAKAPVTQHEFDALVDLAFNIGLGALKSSSLLRCYLAGDKAAAARKFMDWNKAGGKVVAGLTARRRREAAWFMDGGLARTTVALMAPEMAAPARVVDHPDNFAARWLNERRTPDLPVL